MKAHMMIGLLVITVVVMICMLMMEFVIDKTMMVLLVHMLLMGIVI